MAKQDLGKGGCGPALLRARLRLGEHVLDLGCGSGTELLQAAELVGKTGTVYGLDPSSSALKAASRKLVVARHKNVQLLDASAEAIPLADMSLDAVYSNCVLNLVADKIRALKEIYRILKPCGRFVFTDTVALCSTSDSNDNAIIATTPADMLNTAASLIGCTNGVVSRQNMQALLAATGFLNINTKIHTPIPYSLIERRASNCGRSDELVTLNWSLVHDALASVVFSAEKL